MMEAEDFKKASKKKGITFWPVHICSICGFNCGYEICGEHVGYNSGCGCITCPGWIQERSWEDLAEHYNMQNSEKVIQKMNEFWGFNK